jgi:putative hemolysin
MKDFEIKISRDRREIREAQRLRFEVFNLEMKKGLKASYESGLDVDDFDPICEPLIVREPQAAQPGLLRDHRRKSWKSQKAGVDFANFASAAS